MQKWYGQELVTGEVPLEQLENSLPMFSRHQFGVNEYLDVIVREPFQDDQREIPVSSVSKRYVLIQHSDVAHWVLSGVNDAGISTDGLIARIRISEYGERFYFTVPLDSHVFDPGDGYEIQPLIEVRNSVDKTTALEIKIMWERLICTNGMYESEEFSLRVIHNRDWMKSTSIPRFITDCVSKIPSYLSRFSEYLNIPVTLEQMATWCDTELPRVWGVTSAVRFFNIVASGIDGEIDATTSHLPPSERRIVKSVRVPGACDPVKNIYHALQALSWVASRQPTVEKTFEMRKNLPNLIDSLAECE